MWEKSWKNLEKLKKILKKVERIQNKAVWEKN